jgi:hypothetical protein
MDFLGFVRNAAVAHSSIDKSHQARMRDRVDGLLRPPAVLVSRRSCSHRSRPPRRTPKSGSKAL